MRDIVGLVLAALFGLLFGLGLIVSQMTDPARIIAVLDIFGDWNPSLLFVMMGAVVVATPAFCYARAPKHHALLGDEFQLPASRTLIDSPLVIGAALFGAGWGLAGLCPGPSLALLGTFDIGALIFVPALIVGSLGARYLRGRNAKA